MDYDCVSVPIDKLVVSAAGMAESLCNTCCCVDCTNPIQEQTVYVVGIPKKMRLWTVNTSVRQVVSCKGFVDNENVRLPPGD